MSSKLEKNAERMEQFVASKRPELSTEQLRERLVIRHKTIPASWRVVLDNLEVTDKVERIKTFRTLVGSGLLAAKTAVELYDAEGGARDKVSAAIVEHSATTPGSKYPEW